jgi:hypothetical protein
MKILLFLFLLSTSIITTQGKPYLSGIYHLRVKGFKISTSYIDTYDPQRIRDKMQMSRFEFYLDYEGVKQIEKPSQVHCPLVL